MRCRVSTVSRSSCSRSSYSLRSVMSRTCAVNSRPESRRISLTVSSAENAESSLRRAVAAAIGEGELAQGGPVVAQHVRALDERSKALATVFALEIEWNNKDPFYDRDLNNFRLLFELRTVSVGVASRRRGRTISARQPPPCGRRSVSEQASP